MQFKMRFFVCCKSRRNLTIQDKLYLKGREKLVKLFDIVNMMKSIRKIELISQIVLSKHQMQLLPYLKHNILDEDVLDGVNLLDNRNVKSVVRRKQSLMAAPVEMPAEKLKHCISYLIEAVHLNETKVDHRILK